MRTRIGPLILTALAFFFAVQLNAQINLSGNGVEDLVLQLQQQGWQEVAPGVLQRHRPDQQVETLAFGADGLGRALQEIRHRFAVLQEAYEKAPSAELDKALGHLWNQMEELEKTIAALQTAGPAVVIGGCDVSFGCDANAYPLGDIQGVGADSNSYFWNNCGYEGTAYADAQGATNSGYDFQARFPSGSSVSASASVRVPGGPPCFSDALSYVDSPALGLFFSCYNSNASCPPLPPRVDLWGPSYVYVWGYECVTEYWSASASGGTPPYTFSWSDGSSGTSISMTFCGWGGTYTDYVNVSVTAYDSAGQSDSASMTTTVHYQGDPCPLYLPYCEPLPY